METNTLSHYVFVDFENVAKVDLRLIAGRSVQVTLMIGKNQRKLDLELVRQIQQESTKVVLKEVGASGRNALDLTLAYHLGQAVVAAPKSRFHIVSNDQDFDPLVEHLLRHQVWAFRHSTFSAQIFSTHPKKKAVSEPVLVPVEVPILDRFEKLVSRMTQPASARPKTRARLLAHIQTAYGHKIEDSEAGRYVDALVQRGVLVIEETDKIRYLGHEPT